MLVFFSLYCCMYCLDGDKSCPLRHNALDDRMKKNTSKNLHFEYCWGVFIFIACFCWFAARNKLSSNFWCCLPYVWSLDCYHMRAIFRFTWPAHAFHVVNSCVGPPQKPIGSSHNVHTHNTLSQWKSICFHSKVNLSPVKLITYTLYRRKQGEKNALRKQFRWTQQNVIKRWENKQKPHNNSQARSRYNTSGTW